MLENLESDALTVLSDARRWAEAAGRDRIGPDHILLALIHGRAVVSRRALVSNQVSLVSLSSSLERLGPLIESTAGTIGGFTAEAERLLGFASREAHRDGFVAVSAEHLLLGCLRDQDGPVSEVLEHFGVQLPALRLHVAASRASTANAPGADGGVEREINHAEVTSTHCRPKPTSRRWPGGLLAAIAASTALVGATAAWVHGVGLMSARSPGPADLFERSWEPAWALYVAIAVASSVVVHFPSIARMLDRRNVLFVREEYSDFEVDDPEFEASNRFDMAAQAAVITFNRALMRWAQRLSALATLVLIVCGWGLWTSGPTPRLLGWGAAGVVVVILGVMVWRRVGVFGQGFFRYPARTDRLIPAVVRGLHAGLSGFTGLVLLTPAVVLLAGLLAETSWWQLRDSSPLAGGVASVVAGVAGVVISAPLEAGAFVFILPLALVVGVYRVTERWLAVDVAEWDLPDDVAPVLYLRTWQSDDIAMTLGPMGGRFIDLIQPVKRSNFTESLGRSLSVVGPVALVGEPGTARQAGVGSLWSSDDAWRALVTDYAERALFTVFAASEVPPASGFAWEIELVGSGRTTGRAAIVFPPGFDFARALEPGGYIALAAEQPMFHGLLAAKPTRHTVLMLRQRDGSWFCYDASIHDDLVYAHCMLDMLVDSADDLEEGALGETDFPSTVHMQRFAVIAGSITGLSSETLARSVGLVYPGIRRILVALKRGLA